MNKHRKHTWLLLTAPFRYAYAMLLFALGGRRLCSAKQVNERLAHCLQCNHYDPDAFPKACGGTTNQPGCCELCICCVNGSLDPKVRNKLRIPTERCPLENPRWIEVTPEGVISDAARDYEKGSM